jgi:hypothetical protein
VSARAAVSLCELIAVGCSTGASSAAAVEADHAWFVHDASGSALASSAPYEEGVEETTALVKSEAVGSTMPVDLAVQSTDSAFTVGDLCVRVEAGELVGACAMLAGAMAAGALMSTLAVVTGRVGCGKSSLLVRVWACCCGGGR